MASAGSSIVAAILPHGSTTATKEHVAFKKQKQRVDNSGATGKEKLYRTKAYTYDETGGKLTRVPGAAPVEGVSVIHGPPPQKQLMAINKSNAKGKKISLSTVTVLVLMIIHICSKIPFVESGYVSSNNCYSDDGKNCYWIGDFSYPKKCGGCYWTDNKQHIIVGSNGYDKYNELVWINSTTGKVNEHITVGRLAPVSPGTLLGELYEKLDVLSEQNMERRWTMLFRCLLVHRVLHYEPHVAASIVNACVILHNICNRANIPVQDMTSEDVLRDVQLQPAHPNIGDSEGHSSRNIELQHGVATRRRLIAHLWATRPV